MFRSVPFHTGAARWLAATLVVSVSLTASTVQYSYDAAGRLTGARYDTGVVIKYEYDSNGNMLRRIVDATPPVVALDPAITGDPTPALSGTVDDPDATVQVVIDGLIYDAVNNGDGTWTLPDDEIAEALSIGVHGVTVRAADVNGNQGQEVAPGGLIIDPLGWGFRLAISNVQAAALNVGMSQFATDAADPDIDLAAGDPTAEGGYAALQGTAGDLRRQIDAPSDRGVWRLTVTAPDVRADSELTWDPGSVPAAGLSLVEVDAAGEPVPGGANLDMAQAVGLTVSGGTIARYDLHFAEYVFFLTMAHGWNLLSLPIQPIDASVAAVLRGRESGEVLAWNPTTESYEATTNLAAMAGFWAYYDATGRVDETVAVTGRAVTSPALSLAAGWHLAGPAGLPPYGGLALPLSTTPAGSAAAIVWQHDPEAEHMPATAVQPGHGYWIELEQDADVQLGP